MNGYIDIILIAIRNIKQPLHESLLNQVCWPVPGFSKLFLCGRLHVYICVHVCVPALDAINN